MKGSWEWKLLWFLCRFQRRPPFSCIWMEIEVEKNEKNIEEINVVSEIERREEEGSWHEVPSKLEKIDYTTTHGFKD